MRRRLSPRARFWSAEALELLTTIALFIGLGLIAVACLSH